MVLFWNPQVEAGEAEHAAALHRRAAAALTAAAAAGLRTPQVRGRERERQ
jgi:hypothetical protein